jgi:hypothetical protein
MVLHHFISVSTCRVEHRKGRPTACCVAYGLAKGVSNDIFLSNFCLIIEQIRICVVSPGVSYDKHFPIFFVIIEQTRIYLCLASV